MAFGSMNQGGDNQPMAEINVTPLVDVMLVLLIVFMITMPVLTHSIPLQLPTSSSGEHDKSIQPKEPLRLSIGMDGQYVLGTEQQTLDSLKQSLSQAIAENPDAVLAIAADKDVPYDFVAKVLDSAREAGLNKIGFVVEQQ